MVSELMYEPWVPTTANVAVGVISAIVDNIPVMFAVALGYFASVGVHLWLSR